MSEARPDDYFLGGLKVVELADEQGEYCGKLLGSLGAEVIKVEPAGGEVTRSYGPFYEGKPHPHRSLHFWHYNLGKRSIVLDLDTAEDQETFKRLVSTADVLIDTRPRGYLDERGLDFETLRALRPQLIHARISPFGDDGPWADYQASDLVHLALGGMMMNTGYDAQPDGSYDTPPIAPQMWQAYHITGEIAVIQLMAALHNVRETGRGQAFALAVHDAVAKNTELDLPAWIYARQPVWRQTGRHAYPQSTPEPVSPVIAGAMMPEPSRTKDGRWIFAHRSFLPGFFTPLDQLLKVMDDQKFAHGLDDPELHKPEVLIKPEAALRVGDVINRFVARFTYARDIWKDAQDAGIPWAPVRRPEENLADEHWEKRGTFEEIHYPELEKSFRQVARKWTGEGFSWKIGPRAPLLNEHGDAIRAELPELPKAAALPAIESAPASALKGVRVIDLSWLLASGGAGRFLAAHGAEVIKVEHKSRVDGMRLGGAFAAPGSRPTRDAATSPMAMTPEGSLNRSGNFMEINTGKRSLSLDLTTPKGKEILTDLLKDADMVIEGFSPGTMDRMGFGWKRLQEINPRIVYVQQSGMGQLGTYGRLRSFGPSAQAFSGLSEMSGLPTPYPPAGIGYSYLDWFGAYQMATAMMIGLYRQRETGKGCWIDSSQVECGIYLTGTAVLEHSANGATWERVGNRSPWKKAAPSGAYPAQGSDRWIAITAFTEQQWHALARELGHPEWSSDERFMSLELRLANQDVLDALVGSATREHDRYALMEKLQAAGVPAGVCQTAQDRCECDPQLSHLEWLVELEQSEIGRWPVREIPGKLSETPSYIGGPFDRHGPSYGEDNRYVLEQILGFSPEEAAELEAGGVL